MSFLKMRNKVITKDLITSITLRYKMYNVLINMSERWLCN